MTTEPGLRIGPASSLIVPIAPTPAGYRIAKRSLDLVASVLGIILTSPIMALVAAAVKVESRGPILFQQERLGIGGRRFVVFKFRTMFSSAEEERHRDHVRDLIRHDDSPQNAAGEAWLPIRSDPRVTRIGSFLRRSHLDEFPQLINIVRGEMSLVGPRPPIPYEVEVYQPWHLRRLAVIPGLTGLWQATGWGRLSFDEGVALDLEYIERRSFWLDVRLILRTLWQIVTGRQF
jgi:lipopolysaccharide/colanic/teichoic acid biosynthesis glycosyltransferase